MHLVPLVLVDSKLIWLWCETHPAYRAARHWPLDYRLYQESWPVILQCDRRYQVHAEKKVPATWLTPFLILTQTILTMSKEKGTLDTHLFTNQVKPQELIKR